MQIRKVSISDLKPVVDIYNQVILEGGIIGYSQPFSYKDREVWFEDYLNGKYPFFVAEDGGKVVGWLSISPYRPGRDLLDRTCVVSYFIEKKYRGQGIGSLLLSEILMEIKDWSYKVMLALVFDTNVASIKLLEKHGFSRWAFIPRIAEWKGRILNHVYYGISLE
ncbi:MAG: N-acetyltransferase [Bacteroidales bacterium]|nr:N-acetyltransferase [Bacteroidales bacterium]